MRHALDIETIAETLLRSDLNVNEIEAATGALTKLLPSVSPATADKAGRAVRDLSKITRPTELQKATGYRQVPTGPCGRDAGQCAPCLGVCH